nr:immunoglobulin heavy chain junction region [Mus musculus]MBK4184378.1 immunoglobulin heavy chain junction region [Mus musculus]MBK4184380.1 immunoglobulin heavy chain junction region [Mus musculus]
CARQGLYGSIPYGMDFW